MPKRKKSLPILRNFDEEEASRILKSKKPDNNEDYSALLREGRYFKNVHSWLLFHDDYPHHPVPIKAKYNLRDFQYSAVRWLRGIWEYDKVPNVQHQHHRLTGMKGGIISFEMGLGKTITSMYAAYSRPRHETPVLIVCPKNLMSVWANEIDKFFGNNVTYLMLHPDYTPKKDIEKITSKTILRYDFVITSYSYLTSTNRDPKGCKKCTAKYSGLKPHEKRAKFKNGCRHNRPKHRQPSQHIEVYGEGLHMHQIIEWKHRPRHTLFGEKRVRGRWLLYYEIDWDVVILDESAKISEPKTKVYRSTLALYSKKLVCLSGTPIRNRITDIWSQLRMCGYTRVSNPKDWKMYDFKHDRLKDYILSLTCLEAGIELPDKDDRIVYVELGTEQRSCYEAVRNFTQDALDGYLSNFVKFSAVLAYFMRLRQCAIAPYLITPCAKRSKKKNEEKTPQEIEAEILEEMHGFDGERLRWLLDKKNEAGALSAKLFAIQDILLEVPSEEKVIIFSSFTSVLDLISYMMDDCLPHIKYTMIDGDKTQKQKDKRFNSFLSEGKESPQVLLITYQVGGEGLTLIEANHVINVEPWWNLAVLNQAKARVWRIGQTKAVTIHNLLVRDSFEENMWAMCNDKNNMALGFLEGTGLRNKKGGLTAAAIQSMIN